MRLPRRRRALLCLPLLWLPLGCAFLLPRSSERTVSDWSSFAEAKAAYDGITEYTTTLPELTALGFDPAAHPNVRSLNYLELVRTLVPLGPLTTAELPDAFQRCIASRDLCRGLQVEVRKRREKRIGVWLLDVLRFVRRTRVTGWDFGATLILVDGTVVYKTWHGIAAVKEYREEVRPLGILQEPFDLVRELFL